MRSRIPNSNVWAIAGLFGALVTLAYFLFPSPAVRGILFTSAEGATCIAVLFGLRIHRPEVPRPWILLAVGFGVKTLGDVVWYAENLIHGPQALVVPAQICYGLAYAFLIASFLAFVRLRQLKNLRAVMLDTAMLLVNASVISWMFLMHPMLVSSSATWVEKLVFTSYPIVDLLILGGVVSLLLSNGARPLSLYFLTGGLLLHITGDTIYYRGALSDDYTIGSAVDGLWLVGMVLVVMAALSPTMRNMHRGAAGSDAPLTPARISWFAVAALTGPTAIVVQKTTDITVFGAVGILSSLLLFLLVLTRMTGLVYAVQSQVQDLERSTQKYRALAHNFPHGAVVLFDHDLRFLVADGKGLEKAGFASGDLEGLTVQEALTPTMASFVEPHLRKALTGEVSTAQINVKDLVYEIHSTPVQDEQGDVFAGLILAQDITERKRAEAMLSTQASTLEMMVGGDHLKDVLAHLATAIEDQALGVRCSILLLDKRGTSLRHGAAPSLPDAYNHALDGAPIGPKAGSCGTAAFTGSEVIVSDIASDPLWEDYKDLAIMFGLEACFSSPITSAGGKTLGTFALYYNQPTEPPPAHIELVRHFTHLAGIALERQVTEDRGEELESQLRQSQKMEAMGQLAGGIAHDFNNILSVIRNYAVFVRDEFSTSHPVREDAEEIVRASDQAGELVRRLLAFSRKDLATPQVLDLNDVVTDAQKLFRRTIGENLSLSVDLAPSHPLTKIDAGQLDQVLLNLVVNARDSMPEGGSLTIATGFAPLDPGLDQRQFEGEDTRYVTLSVSDTGRGMSDEIKARVFEPFFTTKGPGEGTGLGLAMVYGIVEAAGGYVIIESSPGVGSTFTLHLPTSTEQKNELTGRDSARSAPGPRGRRILVVEDEEAVRRLVERILSNRGYQVTEAESASEALAKLADAEYRIDLLLTDVRMPGMSGSELAQNVQMLYPAIKVLYMSGYAEQSLAEESIRGLDSWLQKPFSAETLLNLVGRTLDETSDSGVTTLG